MWNLKGTILWNPKQNILPIHWRFVFYWVVNIQELPHLTPPDSHNAWGRVKHIVCVCKLCYHWFRWWLAAYSASSHYLNRCGFIVNWTLGNIHVPQWYFNRNTTVGIQENILKMSSTNGGHCVSASNVLTDIPLVNTGSNNGLSPIRRQAII